MSRPFDELLACFEPSMSIVTTIAGSEKAGCLVGFQTQSSLHPAQFAVFLSKANHTYRVGLQAEHFAVHFLAEDDLDMARLFGTLTGDDVDKFNRCEWTESPDGVPLLERLPNRFLRRRVALVDAGGDHVCVILDPLQVDHEGAFEPLRMSSVIQLRPGHDSEERPHPPTKRSP